LGRVRQAVIEPVKIGMGAIRERAGRCGIPPGQSGGLGKRRQGKRAGAHSGLIAPQ
jgi:hypothetical protein